MVFDESMFLIMIVFALGSVKSQTGDIPICKPPGPLCSVFKRSVCEWSESGEPVWACRGYFETASNILSRKNENSPEGVNAAQESESVVALGTYEYQRPQVSSKTVVQDDSSESEVKFITYTYPIVTKKKKNGSLQEDAISEVKAETKTSSVSPSGKSSSISGTESGSGVNIGTSSSSLADIRSFAVPIEPLSGEQSPELATPIVSQSSSDAEHNYSESSSQSSFSSSSSPASSHSYSEALIQSSVNEVTSSLNTFVEQDDSKSGLNSVASDNQPGITISDPQISSGGLEGGSTSSVSIENSLKSTSQSRGQILGNKINYGVTGGVSLSSGSTNAQQDSYLISSGQSSASFINNVYEDKLKSETRLGTNVGCDTLPTKTAQGTQESSSMDGTKEMGLVGYGGGFVDTNGAGYMWGTSQQHIPYGYHRNALSTQQYNSMLNGYAAFPRYGKGAGSSPYTGDYRTFGVDVGESERGSRFTVVQASPPGSPMRNNYLGSGSQTDSGLHYQQYRYNSGTTSGNVHQNYGTVSRFSNPYYNSGSFNGYGGYQRLERGPSIPSKVSTGFGNGFYGWPQPWNSFPTTGSGGAGYGAHWSVERDSPYANIGQKGAFEPQSAIPIPLTEPGSGGAQSMGPSPALSTSSSSQSYPSSQHVASRALSIADTELQLSSFCKRIMSFCGGTAICDVLEPIVFEFLNKLFVILSPLLKQSGICEGMLSRS